MSGLVQNDYGSRQTAAYQAEKERWEKEKTSGAAGAGKKDLREVGGRTIGQSKLSEKALKYYEQLKKKYSNMDFILVSPEMKEEAERNKGMYGSSKELLVLIDSDKIEEMANDAECRKKYENILSNATSQIAQMRKSLGSNADSVSAFGMTFDDSGNASFFAVIDKSLKLQRERIAAKHEEGLKAKKEEDKKKEEREQIDFPGKITVSADSWDELLKKIDNAIGQDARNGTMTESEKRVGSNIDYSL